MLIGHAQQYKFLTQAASAGQLAHAYLIVGTSGSGKATLAQQFVQYLSCTRRVGQPCGECTACRQVAAHSHPDLMWLAPLAPAQSITIDQVRELSTFTNIASLASGRRVVVLDGADKLTAEAGNALLKALEEPLGRTMFLLLATQAAAVLRTIRSRCVPLHLGLVAATDIEVLLREQNVPSALAKELALASGGRPGVAITLAANPERFQEQLRYARMFLALSGGQAWPQTQAFLSEELGASSDEGERQSSRAQSILAVWLELARETLCAALGLRELQRYQALAAEVAQVATQRTPSHLARQCELVLEAQAKLAANAHVRLTMESLALNLNRV